MDVREYHKTLFDQLLGGVESAPRVWKEILWIRDHFQLDPVCVSYLAGQVSREDGFIGGLAACGVRQDGVLVPIEVVENVLLFEIVEVEPADRDSDDLRA